MGSDKALLPWEGRPLWERQVAVLTQAGASPVAVVRRTDQDALSDLCWRDRRTGCGPLAGLETILEHTLAFRYPIPRTEGLRSGTPPGVSCPLNAPPFNRVAVLAVDMPWVEAEWFQWLLSHSEPHQGAVAHHAEAFEPLAAIYPVNLLAEVTARLDRSELALQSLVRAAADRGQIAVVPIPPERLLAVRSLNSRPPVN